jgi:hypothetical protein
VHRRGTWPARLFRSSSDSRAKHHTGARRSAQTLGRMKNIQIIDGADNAVYDIFAATEQEFDLIFPTGQNVAFINEVLRRGPKEELDEAFTRIWARRVQKQSAMGIHGLLFYELDHKMQYYPTRRDEEAINPNGSKLR